MRRKMHEKRGMSVVLEALQASLIVYFVQSLSISTRGTN